MGYLGKFVNTAVYRKHCCAPPHPSPLCVFFCSHATRTPPTNPIHKKTSYTTSGSMAPECASRSARPSQTSTASGGARTRTPPSRRPRATTASTATRPCAPRRPTWSLRGARAGLLAAARGRGFACTKSSPSTVSGSLSWPVFLYGGLVPLFQLIGRESVGAHHTCECSAVTAARGVTSTIPRQAFRRWCGRSHLRYLPLPLCV